MDWDQWLHNISRYDSEGCGLSLLGRLTVRVEGDWLEVLALRHGEMRLILLIVIKLVHCHDTMDSGSVIYEIGLISWCV